LRTRYRADPHRYGGASTRRIDAARCRAPLRLRVNTDMSNFCDARDSRPGDVARRSMRPARSPRPRDRPERRRMREGRMRVLVRVIFVVSCLAFVPASLYAQAAIAGQVKDSSGAVLPGSPSKPPVPCSSRRRAAS